MKRAAAALAFAFACALSSCAAILGLEHNGADDGAPGEGGEGGLDADSGGGTDRDGSLEGAQHADGGPGIDAPADGRACNGWCECSAPTAQFCADFDEPDALGAGGLRVVVEAGTLAVANDESSSAPNAMASTITQNSFGAAAFVSRSFGGMPNTRFVLRFDLRVDSCAGSFTTDTIVALHVSSQFSATLSRVDVDGGDAIVVGSNNSYALYPIYVKPGAWMALRFDVDTKARVEHAYVDDASFDYPIQKPTDPTPESTVVLEIGQNAAPSQACRLRIDNLTFDAMP